jgi:hypothetical protein
VPGDPTGIRASETLAVAKRQRNPIAKRVKKVVFPLIVLVTHPKALNLIHQVILRSPLVGHNLMKCMISVLYFSPENVTGYIYGSLVLSNGGQFGVDSLGGHTPAEGLLQQNRSGVLVFNEGAERTMACLTEPCEFFQAVEHRGQPGLQERALDLGDVPIQNHQREATARIASREKRNRGRVMLGAGFRRGVDHGEHAIAPGGVAAALIS